MTCYLVTYGTDPTDRFAVYVFATRAGALRASVSSCVPVVLGRVDGGVAAVIEDERDVTFSTLRLAQVCSALGGKFAFATLENRADGIKKLLHLLAEHAMMPAHQLEDNVSEIRDKDPDHPDVVVDDEPVVHEPEGLVEVREWIGEEIEDELVVEEVVSTAVNRPVKPVLEGSKLDEIVTSLLSRGATTFHTIADDVGADAESVERLLKNAQRTHGIQYQVDDGVVRLVDGVSITIKPKKAKPSPKLGQFAPVREGSNLAKLLTEINDVDGRSTDDLMATLAADKPKLTNLLRHGLGVLHGIGHEVRDDRVFLIYPMGKIFADLIKRPAPKPERRSASSAPRSASSAPRGKTPQGDLKPVASGTIRAKIVTRMDGTRTQETIGQEINRTGAQVGSMIFCLWRDCGMGYSFDLDGRVSVVFPEGKTINDAVKTA